MRIGIVDLLGKEPPTNGYSRLMRANNTSIMPQVIAVWCEEEGHEELGNAMREIMNPLVHRFRQRHASQEGSDDRRHTDFQRQY